MFDAREKCINFQKYKPMFVSEVSSNHNQDLQRCLQFIDTSAEIGCDAVKFQVFKINQLFSKEILDRSSLHRERKRWELPLEFIPKLSDRCHHHGIKFACSPFYLDAVKELLPFVDYFKIASYELLWDDLLEICGKTGKNLVLSTGMATFKEIDHAVNVIRNSGCNDLVLLHCVSRYPVTPEECNLAVIGELRRLFNCEIGWSDHSVSPSVIIRAANHWKAAMIEFHLDLDGKGKEYASGHCWLPEEIAEVISVCREGQKADGNIMKEPLETEYAERDWRTEPEDGLRPRKHIRKLWKPN